jgi:SAM-dependent methyltransferase
MDSSSTRLIPKSSQKLPNAWACKIAPVHNRSLRGAGPSGPAVELALTTFAILVLELALIRWLGTQIRIAAYFANLVLVATFLGMGLGVGLGRKHPGLSRWGIPALAIVSIVLAASRPLGLMHLTFPDPAIALWDRAPTATWAQFVGSALVVTACFWCVAAIFMLLGTRVGHLFDQLPPLRAYAVDLGGSLLGVLAMALAAALWATPPVWIALGVLPLVWIHRDALTVVAAGIAIAAAAISIDGARFSPYNRIDLTQAVELDPDSPPPASTEWLLQANRDYHQRMLDLRPLAGYRPQRDFVRIVYELPFRVGTGPHASALVVGAGTGNDVAAALRLGYREVVSIDIDPAILAIGADLHPEHPYSDPRVTRVNDDARAYLGRPKDSRQFDVVCYGLLDSHAMFSSMSSLRLDNFVYTHEGLRDAWAHVADNGVLSVSFSVASEWMYLRLLALVRNATGVDPIVVQHGYDYGVTFLAGKTLTLAHVRTMYPEAKKGEADRPSIRMPTDDWPFLYLRPGTVPWTYIAVFLLIAVTGAIALRGVFGESLFSRGRFDPQMFLLGAAFLLLETRAVTQLSLLFGSTWVVNTSVFAGVLVMVLAANQLAGRLSTYRMRAWYGLLALSLIGLWLLPTRALIELPLVGRGVLGGLAFAIPVFFAGVIFSSELKRRQDAAAALGSNLCGAVVGGLLENLSMVVGLKAIALLALAIYLGSLQAGLRRPAPQ